MNRSSGERPLPSLLGATISDIREGFKPGAVTISIQEPAKLIRYCRLLTTTARHLSAEQVQIAAVSFNVRPLRELNPLAEKLLAMLRAAALHKGVFIPSPTEAVEHLVRFIQQTEQKRALDLHQLRMVQSELLEVADWVQMLVETWTHIHEIDPLVSKLKRWVQTPPPAAFMPRWEPYTH